MTIHDRAASRSLAQPIGSGSIAPPFDNAAMDRHAVVTRASGQAGGPIASAVAARILIGAPIPEGSDAVMM